MTTPTRDIGTFTRREVDLYEENQHIAIRALQAGDRFCISDGLPKIDKDAAQYVKKCGVCYIGKAKALFCRYCGEVLEDNRKDVARRNGGECTQCWACSKIDQENRKCASCGVAHPESWSCVPASVPLAA